MAAFAGGAPAVVSQVMSAIATRATTADASLASSINTMLTQLGSALKSDGINPDIIAKFPSLLSAGAALPAPPAEVSFTSGDLQSTYSQQVAAVTLQLSDGFARLMSDLFPTVDDYFSSTEAWLKDVLQYGGSGINTAVEDQIWARERARTLREAERATDEARANWAARGFPLPPGALAHQIASIELAAQEKIGESSRERAIKTFDVELDQVRFALTNSISVRAASIAQCIELTKALVMEAVTEGREYTQQVGEAKKRLADTTSQFFQSTLASRDSDFRVTSAGLTFSREKAQTDLNAQLEFVRQRVATVTAAVQQYGTMAAAALNGLHASAQISGSDQTVINL